jgi:hypothetical protein
MWQNVVIALAGLFFIVAPIRAGFTGDVAQIWTAMIGGAILLVLAGAAVVNAHARQQVWIQYVNGLIGLWFVIAPWVLSFAVKPAPVIGGLIVLILSAWLAFGVLPKAAASHRGESRA